MVLSLARKEKVVQKIHKVAKSSVSATVATLAGIAVNEITQLRKEARQVGVYIYVVRNTLLKRVVENTSFLCLRDIFVGQNIIAFSTQAPSDSVRVFIKFSKKNETFKIKGAAFEGKFVEKSQIRFLSNLLTYQESLFRLAAVMKMNSIGNLIRILYALSNKKE